MPELNLSTPNIIDYAAARSGRTMEEIPPAAVDGLVFSAVSYIHFDGLLPDTDKKAATFKEIAEAIHSLPERERLLRVRSLENQKLLDALAESRRFSSLRLSLSAPPHSGRVQL